MKYLVIPFVRFLLVAIFFICCPILFFGYLLISLWHWNFKELQEFKYMLSNEFDSQKDEVRVGQQYLYFKNPFDYIIQKKSWKYKN